MLWRGKRRERGERRERKRRGEKERGEEERGTEFGHKWRRKECDKNRSGDIYAVKYFYQYHKV